MTPVSLSVVPLVTLGVALPSVARADPTPPRYPVMLVRPTEGNPSDGPAANRDRPCNLVVSDTRRAILWRMWERSPAFRQQCGRIAAEPRLLIRLYTATSLSQSRGRAATYVRRRASGLLDARIYLAKEIPPTRLVEPIAHELEHVIEQVEELSLDRIARRAPATVWRTGPGAYETRRAILIGRRVAAEVPDD